MARMGSGAMLDGGEKPSRTKLLIPDRLREEHRFLLLLPLALAFYALTSRYPGYVHQDTARVVMLGRLGFGNFDNLHPPLLPWLMHAIEFVLPLNFVTLSFISAANAGVAAWAVWRIARLVGGPERGVPAMLLYCLIPFATFEAVKLNHNTILVSLWPLTTWAFLLALRSPTWQRGAVLGVLAACAMLAKYSSALLLLAMALAALASRSRIRLLTSPAPYVAALVGLVLLAPHIIWIINQPRVANFSYALQSANDPGTLPGYFVRRLALTFVPLAVAFAVLAYLLGPALDKDVGSDRDDLLRALVIIALVPMLMTIGFIMAFGLRASPTWVQPVFLTLPAALAAMLGVPSAVYGRRMQQLGRLGLMLAVVAGPIVLWTGFRLKVPSAVVPHHEITRKAAAIWHAALNRPVTIAGGEHLPVVTAALVLPDKPRAGSLSEVEPWITPGTLLRQGALALCNEDYCRTAAEHLVARQGGFRCELKEHRVLWGRKGPPFEMTVYVIARPGETIDRAAATAVCNAPSQPAIKPQ